MTCGSGKHCSHSAVGLQAGLVHTQRIDVAESSVASSPPKPHGTGPSGTDQATFPAADPWRPWWAGNENLRVAMNKLRLDSDQGSHLGIWISWCWELKCQPRISCWDHSIPGYLSICAEETGWKWAEKGVMGDILTKEPALGYSFHFSLTCTRTVWKVWKVSGRWQNPVLPILSHLWNRNFCNRVLRVH